MDGATLGMMTAGMLGVYLGSRGNSELMWSFAADAFLATASPEQKAELAVVQRDLHSLGLEGAALKRDHWATQQLIVEALAKDSLLGDAVAGFGIHKLGDIYAHAGFPMGIGHGPKLHMPDSYWGRPGVRNAFIVDVTELMLDGKGDVALDATVRAMKSINSIAESADGSNAGFTKRARELFSARGASSAFMRHLPEPGLIREMHGSIEGTMLFEVLPANRLSYTGHRDVAGSSKFVMDSFAAFRDRLWHWRTAWESR